MNLTSARKWIFRMDCAGPWNGIAGISLRLVKMVLAPPGHQRAACVVIVQRYLPHYRRAFFARLVQANPDLDIAVYHGGHLSESDGGLSLSAEFPERLFRNYRL